METPNNTHVQPIPQLIIQPEVVPTEATPAAVALTEVTLAETPPQGNIQTDVTPAIPTEPQKRRGGRLAKLKAGPNSLRFGSQPQKMAPLDPAEIKALHFLIPSSGTALGTKEEVALVYDIATQLSTHGQVGTVTSFGIHDQTWKIALTLNADDALDDDQLLTEAVRILQPTVEATPDLRNGFRKGQFSKWEYRIGAFVAADGNFLNE